MTHTEEEVEEIKKLIKESRSIREYLEKRGVSASGGSYYQFKVICKRYDIDYSHFGGQSWNRGTNIICNPGQSLESLLTEDSNCARTSLKKRILREGLLEYKCYEPDCGISQWKNKDLVLHLDHINGINNDNRIENLRLLCPNCHSQTATYAGKNKTKSEKQNKKERKLIKYSCIDCGKSIRKNNKRCSSCYHDSTKGQNGITKIEWPSIEEMTKLVWEISSRQLAIKLNVSDTAIRKYCQKNNISKPSPGYWAKLKHGKVECPHPDLNRDSLAENSF